MIVKKNSRRNKLLSFLVQYGYLVPVKFYVNHYGIDVSGRWSILRTDF